MAQSEQPDFEKAASEAANNPQFAAMFEGITELQEMAATTHELFQTHINAGFNISQSLYIVAAIFTNNPGTPPQR